MSYKALYRTYRPATFGEVAGQKAIVRTLQNTLLQQKIGHAYLFSGPRGTGKTSMAKLFAKALICEEGLGHQCNKCQNCLSMNEGTHPDVYEIDAASNNGVEDARQLIENINYSPIRGRYKVYIIDEVHMMTQSAFNALLKTLEEPPSNVVFILATTEPHKVIPTILSRCQRYNFSKVSDKDINARLKVILGKEKINYEEQALDLLVSLADGGVRDALSMLDQVLAYASNKVETKDVLSLFALVSKNDQLLLLKALVDNDIEKMFSLLNTLMDNGADIRRLTSDLLNILKDGLLYYKTNNPKLLMVLRSEEANSLISFIDASQIIVIINELVKALGEYRFASDIKNIFEITLLRSMTMLSTPTVLVTPREKVKVKQVSDQVKENKPQAPIENKPEVKDELPPFMVETPKQHQPITVEKEKTEDPPPVKVAANPVITDGEMTVLESDLIIKILTLADRDEKMKLKNELWDDLSLMTMDAEYSEYAVILYEAQPYALSKDILIIETDYKRNANYVNIKENHKIFSRLISKLLKREIPVYALSSEESLTITKKYRSLSQLHQLPKVQSIKNELEGKF